MSYSAEYLEKARLTLEERRNKAEEKAKQRRLEVLTKCPEIGELESEIASAGLDIIKSLGMRSKDAGKYINALAEKNIAAQKKRTELLRLNGFDEDYLEIPYSCMKCSDTGFYNGRFCTCHLKILEQLTSEALSKTARLTLSTFDSFSLD